MKRGMEAVFSKTEKRTPMMKRKPGLAVMIAVGKPKGPPPGRGPVDEDEMDEEMEEDEDGMEMPDRPDPEILLAKIRMLTKRLDKLEAQMNGGESEDEMEDEED
jgi:hypothetical protein